jgi:GxxExxY protein
MDVIRTPLAEAVIGAAIEVHKALGPGLLETPYRRCLQQELTSRGINFEAEVPRPLFYKASPSIARIGLTCWSKTRW